LCLDLVAGCSGDLSDVDAEKSFFWEPHTYRTIFSPFAASLKVACVSMMGACSCAPAMRLMLMQENIFPGST